MLVTSRRVLDVAAIKEIVSKVSEEKYDGNVIIKEIRQDGPAVRFTIRVKNSRGDGARTSWSGRHTPTACWHAHRDVLRALFAECPEASVRTAMARYVHIDGFERTFPATAFVNIGSQFQPVTMPELCDCF